MQVKSKVYYDTVNGQVLLITSEMEGCVEETTKEQDMLVYPELIGKDSSTIDYIELPYGSIFQTFNLAKFYTIDVETKKLNVIYYTQDELTTIQQQNKENQTLNYRVSDISSYLTDSDEFTISSIEDTILEVESNKISEGNGGM